MGAGACVYQCDIWPQPLDKRPQMCDHNNMKTDKDRFLAAFQLLDEHNVMAFNYWESLIFDEEGEWNEDQLTEVNLFSMQMDACCAAGCVLAEVQ